MLDANDQLYDSENSIAACATAWTGENKPTITTNSSSQLVWTVTGLDTGNKTVYGFQVRRCRWRGGGGLNGPEPLAPQPLVLSPRPLRCAAPARMLASRSGCAHFTPPCPPPPLPRRSPS